MSNGKSSAYFKGGHWQHWTKNQGPWEVLCPHWFLSPNTHKEILTTWCQWMCNSNRTRHIDVYSCGFSNKHSRPSVWVNLTAPWLRCTLTGPNSFGFLRKVLKTWSVLAFGITSLREDEAWFIMLASVTKICREVTENTEGLLDIQE